MEKTNKKKHMRQNRVGNELRRKQMKTDERKRNVGQCALRFLFFVFLSFFLPAHFTQYHDWSSGGAATRPTQGLKETEREIDESQLQDKPE